MVAIIGPCPSGWQSSQFLVSMLRSYDGIDPSVHIPVYLYKVLGHPGAAAGSGGTLP
jgi:hypothetical protein